MREIAPLTWPSPNQEMLEITTIPTDSEVKIRIARVDFTRREYFNGTVYGLCRHQQIPYMAYREQKSR